LLVVIKDFHEFCRLGLATAHNASMQGVGTKVGTVRSDETIGRIFLS
jgi:hypothetical protein